MRDSRCWQRRLALNQEAVGSIPTPAAQGTEVIRLDEEPVPKTGGGTWPLVSSSLTASASTRKWSRGLTERLLAYIQTTMVQLHPGLLGPRYANGRAVRLKPECLQVQILPWAFF